MNDKYIEVIIRMLNNMNKNDLETVYKLILQIYLKDW